MDFTRTIIYKLVCNDVSITDVYVGSTTNFIKRKNCHKNVCGNPTAKSHNAFVYQFIRENGWLDNWSMIEIEKYSCKGRLEACKRERYWVETLHATLNSNIPSRTKKQHYDDTKDVVNIKRCQQFICDCGKTYSLRHIARHNKTQKHINYINTLEQPL